MYVRDDAGNGPDLGSMHVRKLRLLQVGIRTRTLCFSCHSE